MNLADRCVVCDGVQLTRRAGIVTPFIAERVYNRAAFRTALIHCNSCEFQFYAPRFDAGEMGKLYQGYRGPQYFSQRNRLEPWYTQKLNSAGHDDPAVFQGRRRSLVEFAERYEPGISKRMRALLDFGGDNGVLISEVFNGVRKFVYDISNVELLPGIEKATLEMAEHYDLIICSNVLEHVPYPHETMDSIDQLSSKETVLYLEVPYENPRGLRTLAKRVAQQSILLALRPRQFIQTVGSGMFTHMHEHVNYWSEEAMRILLEKHGFRDISVRRELINNYPYICAFGRK